MRFFLFFIAIIATMGLISCKEEQMQNKPAEQKSQESPKISKEIIPGGYLQQDPKSEDMQKMAHKACDLLSQENPGVELVQVLQAGTQVVAGLNYYFRLEAKIKDKVSQWDIIMYEDMGRNCSLTTAKKLD